MVQAVVVDASVLIQAYIIDTYSARVETLLSKLDEPQAITIHVPEFCLIECTNILWKWVRFQGLGPRTAQQSVGYLNGLPLIIHPVTLLLPRALSIGLDHELAVYDALYLALAEKLAAPLITVDERQSKVASKMGLAVTPITDFPEWQS